MRSLARTIVLAGVLIAGIFIAPAVASAGTVTGEIRLSVNQYLLEDCSYELTYSGGPPPADISIDPGSFAAGPGPYPCDPDEINVDDGIEIEFAGSGSNWAATYTNLTVVDNDTGCVYSLAPFDLTSVSGANGPYSVSRQVYGSGGFFCSNTRFSMTAQF